LISSLKKIVGKNLYSKRKTIDKIVKKINDYEELKCADDPAFYKKIRFEKIEVEISEKQSIITNFQIRQIDNIAHQFCSAFLIDTNNDNVIHFLEKQVHDLKKLYNNKDDFKKYILDIEGKIKKLPRKIKIRNLNKFYNLMSNSNT